MDFSLFESVPDAMIVADEAGTIVWVNAIAERLFGWTRAEIVGHPVETLIPARFRTMHEVHRAGYHAAPRARPMGLGLELSGLRKGGAEFPAEISLSPIEIDGRRGVVAAVRDVTERKMIEERARRWQKASDEVRERDEFLSVASHELRTPVTALQLQLQLLRRASDRSPANLPALVARKLEMLDRQTRRIAALVSELIDVSRMRLGAIVLRRQDLDVADVARGVAAALAAEIARSGSRLDLDLSPARGRFDRARIELVISNLLLNAVKFGEGRPIELGVDAAGERVRIRVVDRGVGIASEHQSRLFERFARAVPADHSGGLGLGLYAARHVVEAHGGEIRVESRPGQGSTFIVEIPRESPSAAEEAAAHLH